MVFWRSGAKLSEILATVVATSVVWSVDKTRCPVSAAATAILILSASRISPTTITSGACLTAARNAVGCDRGGRNARSEEHTSELQSHSDLVCRLLLEKKK